jgi:hypothetical protein
MRRQHLFDCLQLCLTNPQQGEFTLRDDERLLALGGMSVFATNRGGYPIDVSRSRGSAQGGREAVTKRVVTGAILSCLRAWPGTVLRILPVGGGFTI